MKKEELLEFIRDRMSMSHVYQPILIRTLLDSGGSATVRQIAQAFLLQDESQLDYYERRVKEMPVRVLGKHGIVEREGDLVSLTTPVKKLSLKDLAELRLACDERLQSYVQDRGIGIWDHRMLENDPVPDSIRYKVLKRANGRCELCGVTKKQRPLDVDHIIPRSRGGSNELENLQALCSKCNRSKRDKDDTDFRDNLTPEVDPDCPFCGLDDNRLEAETELVLGIRDAFPVTDGHTLILPRRHTPDFFSMSAAERRAADDLLRVLKNRLTAADPSISGFNIGVNAGEAAGQTVMHAHLHLIPRRESDVDNPRGGVRGVVPGRMDYGSSG